MVADSTFVKDLTETQILEALRVKFEGVHISDLDIDALADEAETLGDLYKIIQREVDRRDHVGDNV
jgi:hypothetical protein